MLDRVRCRAYVEAPAGSSNSPVTRNPSELSPVQASPDIFDHGHVRALEVLLAAARADIGHEPKGDDVRPPAHELVDGAALNLRRAAAKALTQRPRHRGLSSCQSHRSSAEDREGRR